MKYQGIILSVAAPSGTGKTSLVKALLERQSNIDVAVSHTTRPARPSEENGKHYHFVSDEGFQDIVQAGGFVEYAPVFDHFYGTSKETLELPLSEGRDVMLDIDWQGAASAERLFPDNAVSVYLLPPSRDELVHRLKSRGQDSDEVIQRRMISASAETSHYTQFDYLIVNDDFDHALNELEAILIAERCRRSRQEQKHARLLKDLC